jgi:uncharacterized protein (DUF58 family)
MAMPPRSLYRLFPLAAAVSAWSERRLSATGQLLAGLLVASAVLGIDVGQTRGYQVATLVFALLAVGAACSLRWRPALAVRRLLPGQVTAGQSAAYWIEIHNAGARTERDLWVEDALVTPNPDYATFRAWQGDDARPPLNRFDRAIGFPRWLALRRHARGADLARQRLPAIAPGATARVRVDFQVLRRGRLEFECVRLLRPDPLGLWRAVHTIAARDTVLALPRRHAMPRVHLRSERRYQRGGISLAAAVGDAQEFAALRDYRPGDPRRHIHWRSFARTGTLIVKEYQDEYFDRHALLVDTRLPRAEARLFEAVIEVAASVAGSARPRDSILDLIVAGTEVLQLSTGRGLGDQLRAHTWLAEVQASGELSFEPVAALLRERMAQLASIVLVLGGWDRSREALVAELARRGVRSASLLVTHDAAAGPPPGARGAHRQFVIRTSALAADLARVELGN